METPKLTLRIDLGSGSALGPGKIRLLEAIEKTGSISQAGRKLGMSYRRAWLLVERHEQLLPRSGTGSAAAARFAKSKEKPDLIISDYHLADGKTGIEVIDGLRRVFADEIPAFLVSGDTDGELLRKARVGRYILLVKPVDPMALRATLAQTLTARGQPAYP
jgi:molybdate transport repressor ModE-like protein